MIVPILGKTWLIVYIPLTRMIGVSFLIVLCGNLKMCAMKPDKGRR
jgi:hypothetical protein